MPEISIIVPIYNVEDYLEKCINSILEQTFRDFELILVDDGSTDSCSKICDKYKEKDSRICVIHRTNGGLSAARNSGLDVAQGNYIGFVDSDDYIAPDMYEYLLGNIKKQQAKIASCPVNRCNKSNISHHPKRPAYQVFHDTETALKSALKRDCLDIPVWNRLYKKEVFDTLRFPVGHNYEDLYILTDIFANNPKIVSCPEAKYFYVDRSKSITKTVSSRNITDMVEAYRKTENVIKCKYPLLYSVVFAELYTIYRQAYNISVGILNASHSELEQMILSQLYKNKTAILTCTDFTFLQKKAFQLFFFNRPLYTLIFRIKYFICNPHKLISIF